ncbi:uncharacterized protein LTR77_002685 [Saxophila tyrrhenica]|uniref:Uncharacterized protein n=1 Tax=Saxophila tyrrhenica TaxID=1690608 RepID=A0AAV9PIZ0_9PEZI|nr:hypothetical protein LTR77_002685 [Saxophila tyrrhenica]
MLEQFRGSSLFLTLQHALQVVLAGYALRHSYVAITKLRKYEATTKKAAKWSDEAQQQLNKTRTTQGAGAITAVVSLLASLTLIALPNFFSGRTRSFVSPTLLVLVIGARRYIKSFWAPGDADSKGKDKGTVVPLPKMEEYNEAVQKTEDLLKCLEYLEYSWVITSVFGLMKA